MQTILVRVSVIFGIIFATSASANVISDSQTAAQIANEQPEFALGQIQLLDDVKPGEEAAMRAQSNFEVKIAAMGPVQIPKTSPDHCRSITGVASVYGMNQGSGDGAHQKLAGGGRLNGNAVTAAMLNGVKLNTYVEVENLNNGKTARVLINDRGPYAKGRILDASLATEHVLGFHGLTRVLVKVCR
jgi:rare lipoprotein A (peptidoglycan hydrolase)